MAVQFPPGAKRPRKYLKVPAGVVSQIRLEYLPRKRSMQWLANKYGLSISAVWNIIHHARSHK